MITERLVINVVPGREDEFEKALSEARFVLHEAVGFRRFAVEQGVDRPSTYWVVIGWETEEERQQFRDSDDFTEWATALDPYVQGTPTTERYDQRRDLSL